MRQQRFVGEPGELILGRDLGHRHGALRQRAYISR